MRLLSDFETPQAKLLQIILAGQPELGEKLAHPRLNQLHQRIASFSSLKPFGLEDTKRFIDHRLRVAGYSSGRLFDPRAVSRIAALSAGIPRLINNLCFHSLSLAFALRKKTIDLETVEEVAQDLDIRHLLAEQDYLPASDGSSLGFDSGVGGGYGSTSGVVPAAHSASVRAPFLDQRYQPRVRTAAGPIADPLSPISPSEARDYMQKVVQTLKDREQKASSSTSRSRPEGIVQ